MQSRRKKLIKKSEINELENKEKHELYFTKRMTRNKSTLHAYVPSPCSPVAVSYSLRLCGMQPARFLCPWNSPIKNAGAGCHALLQGIFPTQGSNLCLLLSRQILDPLSHQGSPLHKQTICYLGIQRKEKIIQPTCQLQSQFIFVSPK